jgi:hypothetical protein
MTAHANFMFMRTRILTPDLPAGGDARLEQGAVALDPAFASPSGDDGRQRSGGFPGMMPALISNAHRQGYHVYAEVPAGKAAEMAGRAGNSDLAGIILNLGDSQPSQLDQELQQLRSAQSQPSCAVA